MGNINLTKLLRKQGLRPNVDIEGIVIDNKDSERRCRVKVRIKELHKGIKDAHLPWCISKANALGAKGGNVIGSSGIVAIPKIGTKVLVEFQDGDPHFPVYKPYTHDDETLLAEANKNYPNRAVIRFGNGTVFIIDTATNEMFIHNPGDLYQIVQGDLHTQVFGDSQETCAASKTAAIDPYFIGDEELPISKAKQHQTKSVQFKGLGKHGSGNKHIDIGGDYSMTIQGNRITEIFGNDQLTVHGKSTTEIKKSMQVNVKGTITVQSESTITIDAKSELKLKGSIINLN
jgi:uncharacterized protein involved in type VI secretion and phage assembly